MASNTTKKFLIFLQLLHRDFYIFFKNFTTDAINNGLIFPLMYAFFFAYIQSQLYFETDMLQERTIMFIGNISLLTLVSSYHFTFPFSIEDAPRLFLSFHNLDYSVSPKTVVYLYRRDPVNVIYSWIPPDFPGPLEEEAAAKAREYGQHLDYYLYQKNYIEKKCVMVYEELQDNTVDEVCKLLNFLDEDYTLERVREVCSEMTRSEEGRLPFYHKISELLDDGSDFFSKYYKQSLLSKKDLITKYLTAGAKIAENK